MTPRNHSKHHYSQPSGRHIPEMLDQQRRNTGKLNTKRRRPKKKYPTTMYLIYEICKLMTKLGQKINHKNTIKLRADSREQDEQLQKYCNQSTIRFFDRLAYRNERLAQADVTRMPRNFDATDIARLPPRCL